MCILEEVSGMEVLAVSASKFHYSRGVQDFSTHDERFHPVFVPCARHDIYQQPEIVN